MDDSIMEDDSIFNVAGDDSDDAFSPEPKPIKTKAPAKKAAAPTKPKPSAPKKSSQTTLKSTKPATKKRPKPSSDDENSDGGGASLHDDSLLSNTPPSAKRQKKVVPKKSSGKPLQPIANESLGLDGTDDGAAKPKADAKNDQYKKLSHVEHILQRPDTYIGSVERVEQKMWVFNSQSEHMEYKEISFVPGLYKIFDEILVNAADNKQRDKNMSEIRVAIDREAGQITVKNNGRGIPIELHSKEGIYIPEMIFGHLLSSSNYDDDQQKVTGGRNGYGAKLANVYSTHFQLETVDSKSKQKYKQTWTDNMSKMSKATITPFKSGDDYTSVSFKPDFSKFGMKEMDEDFEALVKKRVYDMAGTIKDVRVYLNGEKIKVRNFKKYMELYTKAITAETLVSEDEPPKDTTQVILTDNPNERWEIGFAVSDGSFQQVSFVNAIATTTGGTHVNYVADQIVEKLMQIVKKKNKGGVALKNAQIRNHIFLFVNCLIVNPAFTSQTKEQLTTKPSQFGSKCTVSEKFLKDIAKTEAVDNILHFAQKKADQVLKKSDGNRRTRMNHAKLTDANKAGTKDGWQCTLILTEGDSASLLALAGRAFLGPDRIGVFPLRGKLLNVRDASIDQISKNQEIQNIKKFLGLQHKKVYEDTRSLRYGHLMIMTDQDHDGSHIKGLLINFLECSFPSLLKLPGFLQEFITPIVKVWKGDPKHPKKLQSFFTMPEYEAWKEIPGNERGWDHKYFKGLGTNDTTADAEIYFRDLDRHLKQFAVIQAHEPQLIDMAFSKKKADARKEWLREFRPGTYLDMSTAEISYENFINKELILFSMADNFRSIPSVVDGFKPGQRKVLYTCFRRNLKKDVKVVELAGSVSGLTAYAYGDTSLQQTIVGLAQNFVGSNNINCLEPSGNFGSRLQGGADAASARYIYTRLSPFARKIFHTADEPLLTYNKDDGKDIEPEMYVPILPMVLVNGADGIGTGWSSSIPNYNPEDIVANLKLRMAGTEKADMIQMKPWFRGWKGDIEIIAEDKFKFPGIIRQTGDNEVEITELPVRFWTQDFKEKLEDIIKAEKIPSFVKDYTEYNTPLKVHFVIKMEDKHIKVALERGLEETFKLARTMTTTNLVAFDGHGRIHKYATPLDMLEEFYLIRLKFYEKRKKHLLGEMDQELDKLNNQARFIQMIIDGKLTVNRKKKAALVAELREKGFKPIPKVIDRRKESEFEPVVDEAEENADPDEIRENQAIGANDYDYLLGMAIWSLTQERIEKLRKQIGDKETEYKTLTDTSPKQLWTTDLDEFIAEWRFQLADEERRAKKAASKGRRASAKLRIAGKTGSKKRKNDDSDDDSDFGVTKPKKAAASKSATSNKPQPSSMFDFLTKKEPTPVPTAPPKTATSTALLDAFSKPLKEVRAIHQPQIDGTASEPPEDLQTVAEKLAKPASRQASVEPTNKPARPTKAAVPSKKPAKIKEDSDEDSDAFMAVAAETTKTTAPVSNGRQQRARKQIKYNQLSDDESSDNGDDMLGDVTNLVRGKGEASTAPSKPFFSQTTSRPSSSGGVTSISKARVTGTFDDDTGPDETDYTSLVPKGSPEKPAARSARDIKVFGEDDDDSLLGVTAVNPKSKTIKRAGSALKSDDKARSKQSKSAVAAPAGKSTELSEKPETLSPAAKAYAKKLAKAESSIVPAQPKLTSTSTNRAASKSQPSTKKVSDEVEDVDMMADEILGDDEDNVQPAGRPARRAVASRKAAANGKRSRYVFDDDSDEDEDDVDGDDGADSDDFDDESD